MTEVARPTSIEVNGQSHKVVWGLTSAMLGGFEGNGYDFEDASIGDEPVGFYHIAQR